MTRQTYADNAMVEKAAASMTTKMDKARQAGRANWFNKSLCGMEQLHHHLLCALADGDMVSVMNYAGMLHYRGENLPVILPSIRDAADAAADAAALGKELDEAKAKIVTQLDTIRLQNMTIDQQNFKLGKKGVEPVATMSIQSVGAGDREEIYKLAAGTAQTSIASAERDRAYVTYTKSIGDIVETTTADFDLTSSETSGRELIDAIVSVIETAKHEESVEVELDLMRPGCC